jgi:two-component system, NarL family, sensor histidine kinase UhpB
MPESTATPPGERLPSMSMAPLRPGEREVPSEPPDGAAAPEASRAGERRYVPLFRRVAGVNALLLLATVAITILVLDPDRASSLTVDTEVVVLVAALALLVLLNLYLVRRVVKPVLALTALTRRVDLDARGERIPGAAPTSEAGELALRFNEMLDRLAAERRAASGLVLAGQEAERLRIARELHDQVGQELTAVLLGLARLEPRVPGALSGDVCEIQEDVRSSLESLRRLAVELRPEALDDLGLPSALAVLGQRISEHSAVSVTERIAPALPPLASEVELVIYRVAQEALTNVVRHSGSRRAELTLAPRDERLVLSVRDHGRGLGAGHIAGTGLQGMRERAALIGATLQIAAGEPGEGCEVCLEVPLRDERR